MSMFPLIALLEITRGEKMDKCPACGQPLKRVKLSTLKGWFSWSEFFTQYCDNPKCPRYKLKVT